MTDTATSARYRFGDAARSGVLLGLSVRQSVPLIAGVGWLTLCLVAQQPLIGMAGLAAGGVAAFGRWRRAPLYEVAVPGCRLVGHRLLRRWPVGASLPARRRTRFRGSPPAGVGRSRGAGSRARLATHPGRSGGRARRSGRVGVDRGAGAGRRVPGGVAARAGRPARRVGRGAGAAGPGPLPGVTGDVAGVDPSRRASPGTASSSPPSTGPHPSPAGADYDELLDVQAPVTIAHEVLLTVTVDRRRIQRPRRTAPLAAAIDALGRGDTAAGGPVGVGRAAGGSAAVAAGAVDGDPVALRPVPGPPARRAVPVAGRRRRAGDVGVGTDGGRGGLVPRPGRRLPSTGRIGWRPGRCCRWPPTGWPRCSPPTGRPAR